VASAFLQESTLARMRGTYAYMDPLLYEDETVYAPASDVYSFAVVLWELASRVFHGKYRCGIYCP
jgi:serine/threonine protein kinase